MEGPFDQTALDTIELLESRLQRIEFVLTGNNESLLSNEQSADPPAERSVAARLSRLEGSLRSLTSRSRVAQDILSLLAHHPDLFQSLPSKEPPSTLTTSQILSIVLSFATLYPTTASRLTSLRDTPIPPAEMSTELIALGPRIARLEILQAAQAKELAKLRERSAAVLQRWYQLSVLGEGECWTEWEGRMAQIDRSLKREEVKRLHDENTI